jgi:hypothetical protein
MKKVNRQGHPHHCIKLIEKAYVSKVSFGGNVKQAFHQAPQRSCHIEDKIHYLELVAMT